MAKGIKRPIQALLAAAALAVAWSGAALAKSEIVVVDTVKLWAETKAGKDVQAQLTEFSKKIQTDLDAERDGFQEKVEDLRKKKESLQISEPVFNQRLRELQADELQFQRRVQESQTRFQIATGRARTQFADAVRPTLEGILKKHKGSVLLERGTLIAISDQVDVTDEAIKAVDKKLDKLKVDLNPPAPKEAAGGEVAGPPAP